MTAPPRILLARPDHLGDVLLTLPAAAALRRAVPSASISYLVDEQLRDVPLHCPHVDAAYGAPFPPPDAAPSPPGWGEVVARESARLAGRFDAVLFMRPNDPWSGALAAAANIPMRLGYAQPGTVPFATDVLEEPQGSHAVILGLEMARAAADRFGGSAAPPETLVSSRCFESTTAEEDRIDRLLADLPGVGDAPFVVHPGSGWPLKNWPADRWGVLTTCLARRYERAPLVVGSPGEKPLVDAVLAFSEGRGRGVAGLTIGEVAALHRRSSVVVTTDSGALHLAAMVGARVVGLYGPGDPSMAGPWAPSNRSRVVRVELPCSPCRAMHDAPCGASTQPACVTGIAPEAVLIAVEELLAPQDRGLIPLASAPPTTG